MFTFEKKVAKDVTKVVDAGQMNLNMIIKNLPNMRGIDDEYVPQFKFFQVKRSYIKQANGKNDKQMICFIDISSKILYDSSKAEGEFLSLINSTISHEMRNPLNSIINQCEIVKALCQQFYSLILSHQALFER